MPLNDSAVGGPLALVTAEKQCLKCGQIKPIAEFPRSGRAGYRARCKPCHCEDIKTAQRASRAQRRAERAQRLAAITDLPTPRTAKCCARCKQSKPLEDFNRCSKAGDGRHSYCRVCAQEYKRHAKARHEAGLLTDRQQLAAQGLKRCPGCEKAKPPEAFKRQGTRRFYLCRECEHLRRRTAREAALGPARAEAERLYQLGLKACTLCRQVKPLGAFGAHVYTADGLNWWCKTCNSASARAYYALHTELRIAYARAYYDAHRVAIRAQAREQLQRLRETDPGALQALYRAQYQRYKESATMRAKAWAQKNPERVRKFARDSYHRNKSNGKHMVCTHNRRARLLAVGGRLSAEDIVLLYDVQRGRCAYCMADLAAGFHCDHMTPVSHQGRNDVSNVALACPNCNRRKSARSAGTWLRLMMQERAAQAQTTV